MKFDYLKLSKLNFEYNEIYLLVKKLKIEIKATIKIRKIVFFLFSFICPSTIHKVG